MAKFNSRAGSEDKGRSGRSREDRPGRRGSSSKSEDDKKKKDGYKSKRSFSKNKVFREIKETRDEKPRRSFDSEGRKPFKRPFDKKTDRPERSSGGDSGEDKKPFREKRDSEFSEKPRRSFSDRDDKKPFRKDFGNRERNDDKPRREFSKDDRKPFREDRESRSRDDSERPRRSFDEKKDDRPSRARESEDARPLKKAYNKEDKFEGFKKATSGFAPKKDGDKDKKRRVTKPRKFGDEDAGRRVKYDDFEEGRAFSPRPDKSEKSAPKKPVAKENPDGLIRLNKYLSNAGIASRRDADNLIQSGVVKVNGVVVDQLGYKIKPGDKVTYGDAAVKAERKVYLLLNKPKDYITTVDDPRERKTVMELIKGACRERVYPVGRLDRNTTGLLLFTNDGELTTKLTHPKFGVKKLYHVSLNKGLKPDDFTAIVEGVELEDGVVKADDLAFVGEGKKEVGIEIHSGRNRIVRRIFEHLGYDVIKLDRVMFAGLTKKDLPRGKHRFLTAKEISFLQMIG